MYHYKLNIKIFSKNPGLETELKKTEPFERFEHEFHTLPELSEENLKDGDILILDASLPAGESPAQLRSCCKEKAILVLCAEQAAAASLQEEDLLALDEIWIKPFTPSYLTFLFRKLLTGLKLTKDLHLSQTYLDSAINSMPDMVWFKDIPGAHLKVNDAFCHVVNKPKDDVEGKEHYYIWDISKEEYEKGEFACRETDDLVLREAKTLLSNEKVKSCHGLRQFKTYKSPIFDDNHQVIGTVGIAHDVTDLENMSAELEIILRSMPFAILIKNSDGHIVNANERFEKYFHVNKKDIIGKDYENWKKQAIKNITGINAEGYAEATLVYDGDRTNLEIHEEPIYDIFSNLVGQLCLCRDVTVEKKLEDQILYNSNTDFLTGLYNRRYFYEYVNINRADKPISLIYVDLDYFKSVNDTYGHQSGDEALIATAAILKQCFPEDFIARLGGDEFIIAIMGACNPKFLEDRAGALLAKMHQTFRASEHWSKLSASIGIAQTYDPDLKIDILLRRSDMALYEAKQNGRSRYCIYRSVPDQP